MMILAEVATPLWEGVPIAQFGIAGAVIVAVVLFLRYMKSMSDGAREERAKFIELLTNHMTHESAEREEHRLAMVQLAESVKVMATSVDRLRQHCEEHIGKVN